MADTDRMFIAPAPGLHVRDPYTLRHVPDAGQLVPTDDTYWNRRLADGDVVLATPPAPKEEE